MAYDTLLINDVTIRVEQRDSTVWFCFCDILKIAAPSISDAGAYSVLRTYVPFRDKTRNCNFPANPGSRRRPFIGVTSAGLAKFIGVLINKQAVSDCPHLSNVICAATEYARSVLGSKPSQTKTTKPESKAYTKSTVHARSRIPHDLLLSIDDIARHTKRARNDAVELMLYHNVAERHKVGAVRPTRAALATGVAASNDRWTISVLSLFATYGV